MLQGALFKKLTSRRKFFVLSAAPNIVLWGKAKKSHLPMRVALVGQ